MKPDRNIMPDGLQQTLWKARDYIAERDGVDTKFSQWRQDCIRELHLSIPRWWMFLNGRKSFTKGDAIDLYVGRSKRRALKLIDRTLVARQVEYEAAIERERLGRP